MCSSGWLRGSPHSPQRSVRSRGARAGPTSLSRMRRVRLRLIAVVTAKRILIVGPLDLAKLRGIISLFRGDRPRARGDGRGQKRTSDREVARPKIICHYAFRLPRTSMLFLTPHSLWIAAVVLLIPTTIFAMCGPVIVRRYVPLEQLRSKCGIFS